MRGTRIGAVALVLGVVLSAALAPGVAAQPTVNVTVDGSGLADGGRVTVTDDPALGVDVSADGTIDSVTVGVDGETRETFEPGTETFSDRVTLDLEEGEHSVTVVAEGDGTRRWTATVKMDSNGPLVTYRSPFESNGYPSNGRVTIDRANVTLAADLSDISAIDLVRIERDYEWTFASQAERDRETYRLEDPGTNVSQPLLLGLGENDLKVTAIDEHGQRRTHDFTVDVADGERPTIDLDRFERTGDGKLLIEGTVSDNVKVNSLEYRVASTGDSSYLVNPTSKEPNPERLEMSFSATASINDDTESVRLEATDVAGNTRRWEVPIDYRGHVEPSLSIDDEATRVDGDAIAVEGLVADGRISRVVVETVDPDGTVVESTTVHEGETTDRVVVSERLAAASGETTVVLRATDADGREHTVQLALQTPSTATATPTATVTDRPTATPAVATGGGGDGGSGDGGDGGGAGGPSLPVLPPFLTVALLGSLVGVVVVVVAVRRIDWSGLSPSTSIRRGSATREEDRADDGGTGGPSGGGDADGADDGTAVGRGGPGDDDAAGRFDATDAVGEDDGETRTAGGRGDGATGATTTGEADADGATDETAAGDEADAPEAGETATDAEDGAGDDRTAGPAEGGHDAATDAGAETRRYVAAHSIDDLNTADLAAFVADLDDGDVPALVDCLDADDPATVALAARLLGETAARRPSMVADTGARDRLRDLRLVSDRVVVQEASRAVREFDDADLY